MLHISSVVFHQILEQDLEVKQEKQTCKRIVKLCMWNIIPQKSTTYVYDIEQRRNAFIFKSISKIILHNFIVFCIQVNTFDETQSEIRETI